MIAGIDYSTRAVDVVLLDEDTDAATWHRFELVAAGDAFDRARAVRDAMFTRSWWLNSPVIAVGIEQPQARGPRAANIGALYRIQGAILATIPAQTLVCPLYPSVWRKTVGLPGNASKQDVVAYVMQRWLETPDPIARLMDNWTQDACDAYCIALATRTLLEHKDAA